MIRLPITVATTSGQHLTYDGAPSSSSETPCAPDVRECRRVRTARTRSPSSVVGMHEERAPLSRSVRRVATAVILALVVILAPGGVASAHAELVATDPAGGAQLASGPTAVTLTFSEAVSAPAGAIRVLDSQSRRVDQGRLTHPGGAASKVAVGVGHLGDGAYVVTWRVVSADSHPVDGAFTFQVGSASAGGASSITSALTSSRGGSRAVGVVYGAVRFLVFGALLVLLGGVAFVAGVWRDGATDGRTRRVVWTAFGVLFVATLAAIGLQGAYGAGLPLADVVKPSTIRLAFDTRFGVMAAGRLVLLVGSIPLLVVVLAPFRLGALVKGALAVMGLAIIATVSLAGHAGSGRAAAVALPFDLAHVGAASVWIGGLALLTVAVLPRADEVGSDGVVARFSPVAFACVVVLAVSGTAAGIRQVGGVDALRLTPYGRLLIVKVVLVAFMVGFAAASRLWVKDRMRARSRSPLVVSPGPGAMAAIGADAPARPAPPARSIRRSVAAETLLAIAVLAVTAILVNAVPARDALAEPVTKEVVAGGVVFDLTVDPAKAGPVEVHAYTLTNDGQPRDVAELTMTMSLPGHGITALPVPLTQLAPGHYTSSNFQIPLAGKWTVAAVARLTDIDEARASTTITVR